MDPPAPLTNTERPEGPPKNSREGGRRWMRWIACILLIIVTIISFCPAMLSVTRNLDFMQSGPSAPEQQVDDGVRFQMQLIRTV